MNTTTTAQGGRLRQLGAAVRSRLCERLGLGQSTVPPAPPASETLRWLRGAADHASGMLFHGVWPAEGRGPSEPARLLYVNEAVRLLYGCSPAEAQADARRVLDRLHPDDQRLLAHGPDNHAATVQHLMQVCQPDGTPAWHALRASTRLDEQGRRVWWGHIADVTWQRAAEACTAQAAAAERARQAQADFVGLLSHELRTPLNAILGFTHLLGARGAERLNTDQRRQLAQIAQAGEQMLHLVDEVLDVSRARGSGFSVNLAPADARKAVARCLALAAPEAERAGVQLHEPPGSHRPWVLADVRRLEQVLGNLISNAVKYNRPGGQVHTRLDVAGDRLWLAVADTGPGLTEAQQRQLFQPFNRLGAERTAVPGCGLGLVIVRQLVERMNGQLALDATPGEGACFRIALPLAWPAPTPGPAGLETPAV